MTSVNLKDPAVKIAEEYGHKLRDYTGLRKVVREKLDTIRNIVEWFDHNPELAEEGWRTLGLDPRIMKRWRWLMSKDPDYAEHWILKGMAERVGMVPSTHRQPPQQVEPDALDDPIWRRNSSRWGAVN